MELYFKYLEGVQQADKRIEGEKHVCLPLSPCRLSYPVNMPIPASYLFSFYTTDVR